MGWSKQLDKKNGSRPRCVLLVDGDKGGVANRLTRLVGLREVEVTPDDQWMPWGIPVKKEDGSWDTTPAGEAQLQDLTKLLLIGYRNKRSQEIKENLKAWWNPQGGRTPSWDVASTCSIKGKSGLLLVEAKAHGKEKLSRSDKSGSSNPENREHIGSAISQAASELECVTRNPWRISPDHHYQLSNRFAWSWKLASLGIPVVLLYLGFLKAEDMADDGPLFRSEGEWERILKDHCRSVVDNECWGEWLNVNGTPLLPLIRAYDQPFQPCES